jgi:predicted CoA-substrate-specific enzyme activase
LYSIGIDVGSVSTKGVIFDGDRWDSIVVPTGWTPRVVGYEVLHMLCDQWNLPLERIDRIIGTGYGRIHMPFSHKTVSEISCHGKGAHYLFPDSRGVIDIGGQDSKAMLINSKGKVIDFVLNDKCAAGTGRFLQVTLQAMGIEFLEMDALAKNAAPLEIGNMCAVFAETEVINLLMQDKPKGDIVAGLLQSIAKRIISMAGKIGLEGEVVFTGGLAHSQVLTRMMEELSRWKFRRAENPQITGALGAAVIGFEQLLNKGE